jgi:hypothetical protein
MRWEYRVVTVEKFLADMRYIGSDRWELVTISNDLVYFKRLLGDDGETQGVPNSREEAFALLTDLSKRDDPASQKAANFIRHTIGIANTIQHVGWHFESGYDLIDDILNPKFVNPKIK